jgi:hypothetical protein
MIVIFIRVTQGCVDFVQDEIDAVQLLPAYNVHCVPSSAELCLRTINNSISVAIIVLENTTISVAILVARTVVLTTSTGMGSSQASPV